MAKLFHIFRRFFRSEKKNKAPRPSPVGLIKNWDMASSNPSPSLTLGSKNKASTDTLVSNVSNTTDAQDLDFNYGEGGISDSDERALAGSVIAVKYQVCVT
jgi:hypothetical protein